MIMTTPIKLKNIFVLLLLIIPSLAVAKDSKIKLSESVLYVGQADKKIPAGQGTLYVMDRPSKEPVLRQDVITGTFSSDNITSAKVEFSSGWHFEGNIVYSIETTSKKPLTEVFTYDLTGNLASPDRSKVFNVSNLLLFRQTTKGGEGLKTSSLYFETFQKADDGSNLDYGVLLSIDKDSWNAKPKQRLAPAVFFDGEKHTKTPSGVGTLEVLASDDLRDNTILNKITGNFSGNEIRNANITFSSGWFFDGSLKYEIEQNQSEPYALELHYNLYGVLEDTSGVRLIVDNDIMSFKVQKGTISLEPFSWIMFYPFTLDEIRDKYNYNARYHDRYWNLITLNDKEATWSDIKDEITYCPGTFTLTQTEENEWKLDYKLSSEYHFNSGHIATFYNQDDFSIQYPSSDYIEITDLYITCINKTFPDCIIHLSGKKDSKILWFDGGIYEGTFSINDIKSGDGFHSKCEAIHSLMNNPDIFIDETQLMFLDGTYTYPNGKTEKWENGITDYQKNKIDGNYDKVATKIVNTLREELAAQGAELEKKWQKVLPELREKYGRTNVDAVYGYRLNRKMPLELFEDLARYGLIKLFGPIYSPNAKNTLHEYEITMTNRETGEIQYTLVLKFVHPFWSSPDWILDRYSTNYSY